MHLRRTSRRCRRTLALPQRRPRRKPSVSSLRVRIFRRQKKSDRTLLISTTSRTSHNYVVAESSIQYGNSLDKATGELDAPAFFVFSKKNTNITGVLNYYHRNPIFNHDRGFSPTPPFLSSNNSPYNLQLSSDVAGAAGGKNLNPGGAEFASEPDFINGFSPAKRNLYDDNKHVRSGGGLPPRFNLH